MSIIGLRKIWFAMSGTIFIAGIIALIVWGLRLGVDFTGGTLLEFTTKSPVTAQAVKEVITSAKIDGNVQSTKDSFVLRAGPMTEEQHQNIVTALNGKFGEITEKQFTSIGPSIGQEVKTKSIIAVVLVTIMVLLYIAWAFRTASVPVSSWVYASIVIATFVHDVMVPVGIIAVVTHFGGFELNSTFIAAVLTILGYSINDTIVVFDRVRENLRRVRGNFEEVVETSVRQSVSRSINTSVTTMLALIAIFFFGGESVKMFALTLILGIFFGTYSSIFIASPLLVEWYKLKHHRRT